MFSYTGLSKEQCLHMRDKWHVYMTLDGRISMAGVSHARWVRLEGGTFCWGGEGPWLHVYIDAGFG